MGRELKRVALDFAWPLEEVWEGYLNPYCEKCPHCHAGYSHSYDLLAKHINAMMWDAAVTKDPNGAAITTFLSGRSPLRSVFGHDSTDAWSAVKRLGTLAGLPAEWATCSHCGGDGVDPSIREKYEAWEPTEPPEGPGYQVWETVSEGSPISPVFATPDELAQFMTGTKWDGGARSSYETWLRFITGGGYAPSLIMDEKGVRSGVELYAQGG